MNGCQSKIWGTGRDDVRGTKEAKRIQNKCLLARLPQRSAARFISFPVPLFTACNWGMTWDVSTHFPVSKTQMHKVLPSNCSKEQFEEHTWYLPLHWELHLTVQTHKANTHLKITWAHVYRKDWSTLLSHSGSGWLRSSFLTNQLNNRSDIRTTGDLLSWSVSSNFRPLTRDTMRYCFGIILFKQGMSPFSFITLPSFCSSNTANMLSTVPSLRVWGIWCCFFFFLFYFAFRGCTIIPA